MSKVNIALFGANGHQVQNLLKANEDLGQVIALADCPLDSIEEGTAGKDQIKQYETLDDILADADVDLVVLCSANRKDQADHAIKALKAGKNVYAEKPCAMTEDKLDEIMETAKSTGMEFHEMASTALEQPYKEMAKQIKAGTIGEVVQILAQKSYPFGGWRAKDENIDGGLLMQVGVHAARFVEHVAGLKVTEITGSDESQAGFDDLGGLRVASSINGRLENGGIFSIISNYLNPPCFTSWGNENLRIFGTKGFIEAVDGGTKTRLVLEEKDMGPLDTSEPSGCMFRLFLGKLAGKNEMPFTLEEELSPTRVVIKAKARL